jgi:hypothetical protein
MFAREIAFHELATIDVICLDAVSGGAEAEAWGEWAGKYIGAAAAGGTAAWLTTPFSPFVQGAAATAAAIAGYEYGGRFGKWLTGGR